MRGSPQSSRAFRPRGLRFAWHNHDFEFQPLEDGSLPIEHVLGDRLLWEADLAWVVRGGADPRRWIERYRGRIPLVHVKDIAPAGENADEDGWADVGAGVVPWARALAALRRGRRGDDDRRARQSQRLRALRARQRGRDARLRQGSAVMAASGPMRVGVVGCGNISDIYLHNAPRFRDIVFAACADLNPEAATRQAARYGDRSAMRRRTAASDDVDIVLNLTIPEAHADVSLGALEAGKHVYSEKPLADDGRRRREDRRRGRRRRVCASARRPTPCSARAFRRRARSSTPARSAGP